MQIKGRKVTCFATNTVILLGMFVTIAARNPAGLEPGVIVAFISAFMTNAAFFVGGNSLDKWIRFKGGEGG